MNYPNSFKDSFYHNHHGMEDKSMQFDAAVDAPAAVVHNYMKDQTTRSPIRGLGRGRSRRGIIRNMGDRSQNDNTSISTFTTTKTSAHHDANIGSTKRQSQENVIISPKKAPKLDIEIEARISPIQSEIIPFIRPSRSIDSFKGFGRSSRSVYILYFLVHDNFVRMCINAKSPIQDFADTTHDRPLNFGDPPKRRFSIDSQIFRNAVENEINKENAARIKQSKDRSEEQEVDQFEIIESTESAVSSKVSSRVSDYGERPFDPPVDDVTSDKNTPDDLNTENLDDDLECMTANIDDIDVNIEDEWPNTIRKELEEKDKKKSLFQITNKFGQLLTMTEDTENSLSESLTDSQPLENQTNAATKKAVDQNNPRVSQQNEKDDNIQGTNEIEATSAKSLEGEKSAESSFNFNDTIEGEEADEGEADDDDSDDSETEIANMKAAKKQWMECVAKLWSQGTWSDFGLNCKSKTLEWLEAFLERNKPSFPGIPEPGLGEVQEGGITSVYWDTQNASREGKAFITNPNLGHYDSFESSVQYLFMNKKSQSI